MAPEWTEEELWQYYQERFKRVYADLVAVTGNKPYQISFEIEAMTSHVGVAKTNADAQIVKTNLQKAGGHLERASLDAAKILWLVYRERLQPMLEDKFVKKFCTVVPEHEFVARYERAESLARNARKTEIENVGISPRESVDHYYEAANEFRNLLDLVNVDRIDSIRKFRWAYVIRNHAVSFVMGLLSSAVIALLAWRFLPSQVSVQAAEQLSQTPPATIHKK